MVGAGGVSSACSAVVVSVGSALTIRHATQNTWRLRIATIVAAREGELKRSKVLHKECYNTGR